MHLMNEQELEIAQIQQITDIHFYDLMNIRHQERRRHVMALMVFYQDGKVINCTQTDPEFEYLLRKVTDQYARERDYRTIRADAHTRQVLESGLQDAHRTMAAFYLEGRAYEESLLSFAVYRFRPIEDIVYYQLSNLYGLQKERIQVERCTGYRNKIALQARVNGREEKLIALTLHQENAFHYRVTTGSVLGGMPGSIMNIAFARDRITVSWQSPGQELHMDAYYILSGRGLHIDESLYLYGELKYRRNELVDTPVAEAEAQHCHKLLDLDGGGGRQIDLYPLPWGCYLGRNLEQSQLSGHFWESVSDCVYLALHTDYLGIRQYAAKSLTVEGEGFHVKTDGIAKAVDLHRKEGYGVGQTCFLNLPFAMGGYKRELADKCFYSVCRLPEQLDRDQEIKLALVADPDEFELGYQLLDTPTVEQLWKERVAVGQPVEQ